MPFADLFLLDLIPVSKILDMEECVSVILLQLILLPFSPIVILPPPYVDLSIPPPLPLPIASPLFVYLA